jgi:hypothetical protein
MAIAAPIVSVRPSRSPRLVRAAGCDQHGVQRIEVGDTRYRHQVVAPEVAAFPFDATLLMTLAGRAELRGKPPVRAERHEPHRLTPIAAQDLAHGTRQIVVAEQSKDAAEVGKGELMRFEECLLCRMQVSPSWRVRLPIGGLLRERRLTRTNGRSPRRRIS